MAHKVMIVDDDQTMNALLKTLLELDGFAVALAPRSEVVLSTALAERPDVVLMDVNLTGADGLDLLRQLRAHPDLGRVPVIMTSGMDLAEACQAAGADSFILKPYPPEQLASALKKVLM